jgi:hypothetical protein
VVLAAPAPAGGTALLFETPFAAMSGGGVRIDGAPIVAGELPYPIPAPDAS